MLTEIFELAKQYNELDEQIKEKFKDKNAIFALSCKIEYHSLSLVFALSDLKSESGRLISENEILALFNEMFRDIKLMRDLTYGESERLSNSMLENMKKLLGT